MAVFELIALEFRLRARGTVVFPRGKPGNALRGGFGAALKRIAPPGVYTAIFEPKLAAGPSGLADPPRPFVFRVREVAAAPGQEFCFGANLFDPGAEQWLVRAAGELADTGMGPERGRAEVLQVDRRAVRVDLAPGAASRIRVEFLTPTELKGAEGIVERPEFPVLFARARDRVGALRALYGAGPLDVDFRAMGERAAGVRMTACEVRNAEARRRSARTGQTHPLGGFTGWAKYEGELGEFAPFLEAAQWTGVGRQTVWGKGEISVQPARSGDS
jgi:hypothetical protein